MPLTKVLLKGGGEIYAGTFDNADKYNPVLLEEGTPFSIPVNSLTKDGKFEPVFEFAYPGFIDFREAEPKEHLYATGFGRSVYLKDEAKPNNFSFSAGDSAIKSEGDEWDNPSVPGINVILSNSTPSSSPVRMMLLFDLTRTYAKITYWDYRSESWVRPTGSIDFPINALIDLNSQPGFPGDSSEPGGGGGTFTITSDPVDFPETPALSAVSTGLISLYSPTVGQLNNLASYMWSDLFDINTFKKLFADPMDVIIGLSLIPVQPPISGVNNIKIGYIDTGVACNRVASQYVTVDCGELSIAEYWGSALDYSPYTKFSVYLPFIGTRELKTDDIMRKPLHIKYVVDVLSGACTAMIKCGGSVLYQFSGSCATTIPITGQNWGQMITSVIQLAGAAVSTIASGGSAAGLMPSTANAVMAMKPNVQRTGAVSGPAGMLGVKTPYLIWELPRQSLAKDYKHFVGYPSNITSVLGDLNGFTSVEEIHLENIPATENELTEIEALLKGGVLL